MTPNIIIKESRIKLGIEASTIAHECGFSIQQYKDIESYADELFTMFSLKQIGCICKKLNISLIELYGFFEKSDDIPTDIVWSKMREKNLTSQKLSDLVGINEESIKEIEKNIRKIESWVMDPILDLTRILDIKQSSIIVKIG